jgi:GNAT superfamily N-acetyltransferase
MSITIRAATQTETGSVAACVCHAFIDYIPAIGKQPQPMLDDYQRLIDEGRVFAAFVEESLVGVLVLSEEADSLCIETLATHPRAQGQGIGKALLSFAESVARTNKAASIWLSTNSLMLHAQQIYHHLGFVVYDRRIVNGYDRIFFRKNLTA